MPMIKAHSPLILASGSETRRAMLERVGLDFTVIVSQVDEDKLKHELKDLTVYQLGLELAKRKALVVSQEYQNTFVIAADQICVHKEYVFDKPGDFDRAFVQLEILSGEEHEQICSAVIAHQGKIIWEFQESACLKMRKLSDIEIKHYLEIEQPFNACGSFMFEKHGKHLFEKIRGDQDVILGLPVVELLAELYRLKILEL